MKKNKIYSGFSLVEISVVVLVVGILVASISMAFDMVSEAKLKGARTQTKGAKVNRIDNLLLWLETSSSESLKESERVNNAIITQWNDINSQVTNKIIFKNGSGSTIKYDEIGESNLPALIFSSSSDFLYPNGSTSSLLASNSIFPNLGVTIFAVAKPIASASIFSFCEFSSTYNCAGGKEFNLKFSSDKKVIFALASSNSASSVFTSTNSYASPLIIISALKDSVGQKLFVNGSSAGSTVANTYNITIPFNGTFKIGGDANNVEIYEIIVFSKTLSDSDRNSVEEYLGKKYNLKITKTAS